MIGTRTRIRIGLTVWWRKKTSRRYTSCSTGSCQRHLPVMVRLTCIWSGWIVISPWCREKQRISFINILSLIYLCFAFTTVNVKGKTGKRKKNLQSCHSWWSPGGSIWSPVDQTKFLFSPSDAERRMVVGLLQALTYLLVEESPEHGQGDVQEQHLQHHFHLGNQEFLQQSRSNYSDS